MAAGDYKSISMPFYEKVTPDRVRHDLRSLVMTTLAHEQRNRARIIGFKEVRLLSRVEEDLLPADPYWDKDDRLGVLRGYRNGTVAQRLAHFFQWLDRLVPRLHVILLTRAFEAQVCRVVTSDCSAAQLRVQLHSCVQL